MAEISNKLELTVSTESVSKTNTDLLAFGCFAADKPLDISKYSSELNNKLFTAWQDKQFSGKDKESVTFDAPQEFAAKKIIFIGLGKEKEFEIDKLRSFAAKAIKAAKSFKYGSAAVIAQFSKINDTEAIYALLEGGFLAGYEFKGLHKPEKEETKKTFKNFTVVTDQKKDLSGLIKKANSVMSSVNLARDLVNLPANIVTPSYFEKTAKKLFGANKKVKLSVLGFAEAKKLGMGGFCAVAQGTEEPAKMIILEYYGGGKETYGLIGKGLTFDSGGISIKPSSGMMEMKTDMSGGATVLAAFSALVELGAKKNIIAVIPATENLPSGRAYKPGDVITMLNGTTVEINSTDAEGRMILADALTYAQRLGAKKIIDFATLTGACLIALGQVRTGLMTNAQGFADEFLAATKRSGEKFWQLPMDEEYLELLKSSVADTLNNSESRYAGTVSGGKFLEKFIEEGNKWLHCDIAGTAYLSKPQRYIDKHATGVAIRTLVEYFS